MSSGFISEKGKIKMTAQTTRLNTVGETIVDDITNEKPAMDIDQEKLARLKAKLAEKTKDVDIVKQEEPMSVKPVKKERSINFGVIGSGQCGNRIAETFYKHGYDAVVVNTAQQDLQHIDIPASNKFHLEYGLGGAGKSLEHGQNATLAYKDQIKDLVDKQLADSQAFIFAFSAGGGSGAGSCEVIIDILSETQKPIVCITTIPMESDDAQTKLNTLETLSKLTKLLQSKVIANLFIIDNSKLETIYSEISQLDFFNVANEAIVQPIHIFNSLSSTSSSYKGLDPTELSKLILDSDGISIVF